MTKLEEYYNKFNEDKRLISRHGQVEFNTSIHYIKEYLKNYDNPVIIDIGAGTGRYSIALADEGYDVTAVEPVKYNLGILKKNSRRLENLTAYQGNALKLRRFPDESFDVTLIMGPLYHLHTVEDKVKALSEAKRVTKRGGTIFAAYVMADYAVIRYGFMDGNIRESAERGALTEDFGIRSDENELYDYVRINDIDVINERTGLKRLKLISPDGAADYIRRQLNKMDDKTFELFKEYQLKNAERHELVGAGSHTLDILLRE